MEDGLVALLAAVLECAVVFVQGLRRPYRTRPYRTVPCSTVQYSTVQWGFAFHHPKSAPQAVKLSKALTASCAPRKQCALRSNNAFAALHLPSLEAMEKKEKTPARISRRASNRIGRSGSSDLACGIGFGDCWMRSATAGPISQKNTGSMELVSLMQRETELSGMNGPSAALLQLQLRLRSGSGHGCERPLSMTARSSLACCELSRCQ